jgi:4-aminobutyrate aminotransferase-like enzyme
MAPPLTVSEDEIDLAAMILDESLQTVVDRAAAVGATP